MTGDNERSERRYARVNRILARKKLSLEKAEEKYGYNYEGAKQAGLEPDETGHYPSRNPETGEILKGRKHPTIFLTKRAERKLGYKMKKVGDKFYSFPKNE